MSENREIARAAGLVGAITLVSRIAGLVRDSVMGYYFGTGVAADAFFVAFRIPNLLRRFVAEGAMSTAFIPVFTDYLTNRTREDAVRAASALASLLATLLAILTAIGVVFAPFWTSLFAPGFVGEPGKFELTVRLTRIVFPYIFLVSMVALASGILNSLRHFSASAMSPVYLNLVMIASNLLLCPLLAEPIEGLAYGVIIGGVLQIALLFPPLWKNGIRIRPVWEPYHEAVRRSLRLMAPMVFGAAVYQINIMVDTVLASVLPTGSVSYLWYAARVFEFPLGIFAVALGTAALPSFSAQVARGALDEMKSSLQFSIRLTNFIVFPASVGIMLLATPITSVLFQRGAFGYAEAVQSAQALLAFSVGLWSVSMVRLVIPVFYAMHDTSTPVRTAAATFIVNCLFSVALMGPVEATGDSRVADLIAFVTQHLSIADLRHSGLALSTSLSATVNLVLLVIALHRRLGSLGLMSLLPSLLRSGVASLAMVPVIRWIAAQTDWSASGQLMAHALTLGAAVLAGVTVYGLVSLLLGGDEVQGVTRILRQRLGARRGT